MRAVSYGVAAPRRIIRVGVMATAAARALMALARAKSAEVTHASQTAVLTALAVWLGSKDAVSASGLPDSLIGMLVALGIDRRAAVTVGEMATVKRLTGRTSGGSPPPTESMTVMRRVASDEPMMRAQYILAAARRLTAAISSDRFDAALAAEQKYLAAHVKAGQNRRAAAKRVDDLGTHVLVWRTVMDEKTTPECAAMDGRLFMASNPPGGMIPGAVHSRCRCRAEVFGRGPILDWGTR